MPRLPVVTAREALRALERDGWRVARQTGSHVVLDHADKPGIVVIPVHATRSIKHGTLRGILSQAGLSAERFAELL